MANASTKLFVTTGLLCGTEFVMKILTYLLPMVGLVFLTACNNQTNPQSDSAKTNTPSVSQPASSDEVAVIKTTEGEMVVEFWPDVAPKTVENFKTLARKGFYNGTAFHRIIKGFMIQGGDPLTKDPNNKARFGTGDPGYKIDAEFNDKHHERGVLSMARSADPNSAGSQFFICLGDAGFLDHQYTAFGKLIKGDDVLEKIGNTPVEMGGDPTPSVPTTRVEITSITIVPASSIK